LYSFTAVIPVPEFAIPVSVAVNTIEFNTTPSLALLFATFNCITVTPNAPGI
jgi:hypothetical protein